MAGKISGMLGETGADTLAELHATGKLPEQIDAAIAILDASDIDYADVHGSRGCVFQHIEDYQMLPPSLQEFADDNAPEKLETSPTESWEVRSRKRCSRSCAMHSKRSPTSWSRGTYWKLGR